MGSLASGRAALVAVFCGICLVLATHWTEDVLERCEFTDVSSVRLTTCLVVHLPTVCFAKWTLTWVGHTPDVEHIRGAIASSGLPCTLESWMMQATERTEHLTCTLKCTGHPNHSSTATPFPACDGRMRDVAWSCLMENRPSWAHFLDNVVSDDHVSSHWIWYDELRFDGDVHHPSVTTRLVTDTCDAFHLDYNPKNRKRCHWSNLARLEASSGHNDTCFLDLREPQSPIVVPRDPIWHCRFSATWMALYMFTCAALSVSVFVGFMYIIWITHEPRQSPGTKPP